MLLSTAATARVVLVPVAVIEALVAAEESFVAVIDSLVAMVDACVLTLAACTQGKSLSLSFSLSLSLLNEGDAATRNGMCVAGDVSMCPVVAGASKVPPFVFVVSFRVCCSVL